MSAVVSTEKNIQAAVMQWLNTLPGVQVWRRNVGTRQWEDRTGRKRFMRFAEPGQADVWGIGPNGLHLEIEVKRPGEVPRLDQTLWLTLTREKGGIAFWCDSLGSCVDQLRYEFERRGLSWRKEWEVR